jgi:RimJ/RimL family protein N-acetyltransferase
MGPSLRRMRVDVELRPVVTSAAETRFHVVLGEEYAGWLQLTGDGEVVRLSGEVFPPYRGRGVATAAVATACRIVQITMRTAVLEAFVPSALGAAHRVLEANGFTVADLRAEPLRFELDLATWSGSAGR